MYKYSRINTQLTPFFRQEEQLEAERRRRRREERIAQMQREQEALAEKLRARAEEAAKSANYSHIFLKYYYILT